MWLLFAGGWGQSFGLQGCRGQGLDLLRAEYTLTQTKELFIVWRLQSFDCGIVLCGWDVA